MFEGLVRQLLLGYLGRYMKDFQKEQLKITLWNEEVLLENVELILDAFDYLQLPVALKRGHIGRLSIRIPWKKLGWDPIIILLEDVFFCAGPRDDHEWSADAVGKRELAAKKAKLAAAELAKLSRRVCDNQAGQSFISHVTGRILDSIQVSLRNVHLLYSDMQAHSVLFGLRFSSLTISKQNSVGSLNSKARGGHVSKIVEINGLGIHCSTFQGSYDLYGVGNGESREWNSTLTDFGKYNYVVVPFDLSFTVVKSGRLEHDVPQYSVTAELTKLSLMINPAQLQHILEFSDYICTCQLRELYGRYRPWGCPLSKKLKGWQKVWWRYAQESVISEVHKKLKRTSWRYLGQRLDHRRKYVNLYKVKLNSLRKEQPIDGDVVFELEQMEKDSDIDDILQFRSIAERELEDSLNSTSSEVLECSAACDDKLLNEEVASGKPRGWLNWLSRGVLGAGGSDDSSQFSGVVSDEVIKDICEATKFQPVSSVDVPASGTRFLSAVNLSISQISLLMKSTIMGKEIADSTCYKVNIECKFWEESTAIIVNLVSIEVVSSSNQMTILLVKKKLDEEDLMEEEPSSSFQIDFSPKNQLTGMTLRVVIQPIEICCDLVFLSHLMEFYSVIESHTSSLQKRVLESLNGIRDVKSRLLAKTEYVLSSRQKMIWDVNFVEISFCLPWGKVDSQCNMVMQTRGLRLSSKIDVNSVASQRDGQCEIMTECLNMEGVKDVVNALQFSDIYDLYEVSLDDIQMTLMMPGLSQELSVVEKFSASMLLACCIIPDEMTLRQLEVHLTLSTFHCHFSASIYSAFLSIVEHLHLLSSKSQPSKLHGSVSPIVAPSYPTMPFCWYVAANCKVFKGEINLEEDGNESSILLLSLHEFDLRYAQSGVQDCRVSTRTVNIISYKQRDDCDKNILCSSRVPSDGDFRHPQGLRNCNGNGDEQDKSLNGCFLLHYRSHMSGNLIHHTCAMHLCDTELHCYPYIIRLMSGFCDKLVNAVKSGGDDSISKIELTETEVSQFRFQRFGVSNYCENGFGEWANIPLDQFPFVTLRNCGYLRNLESTILIPEWRRFNVNNKDLGNAANSKIIKTPAPMLIGENDHHLLESHKDTSYIEINLNVANINVHFHDLSSTVGSITLPAGKVSAISHSDSFDVLFSVEELTLFSTWWTSDFKKFVWGPSLPNRSPILNVRARKSSSDLEISFGLQHVCCVVPPGYLAILIGYFSLPDWSSNVNEDLHGEKCDLVPEDHATVYKFEILDSMIMSPVESNGKQLLKLDLQQLYGSFIHNDALEEPLYRIFSEFSVQPDKVAEKGHSLNIFGRDLYLSLLLLKDYESDTLMSNQEIRHDNCTLIQSLSFDLWFRLPDESRSSQMCSSSVCILTKITTCELVAEDSYFVSGLQALLDAIDQLSLVDEKSKCFTGDVAEFLKLESLKNQADRTPSSSTITTSEVRCCIDSFSVKLISSKRESCFLDMIARVDAGFILSGTFRDDVVLNLDVHFSSLSLSSLHDTICLAKFLSEDSVSSVLEIHLSNIQKNEIELLISLPSLEVWLQFFDWSMVIDHAYSCIQKFSQPPVLGTSDSTMAPINPSAQTSLQSQPMITSSGVDSSAVNVVSMSIKFKCIGLSCHIPLWVGEEANDQSQGLGAQTDLDTETQSAMSGGRDSKFFTFTLHSRSMELYIHGWNLKIRTCFDKATGSVGICESGVVVSWPFFQLIELGAEMQFSEDGRVPMGILMEISCEDLDVWLSNQVFYFWRGIDFGAANTDSAELTFGSMDVNLQVKKASLLLTDGRWSCGGPLMELLMRNLHVEMSLMENNLEFSMEGDLLVNYNNIHKVLWEPFLEPWNFQITMVRKCDKSALDSGIMTDVQLKSNTLLNVNVTTSLVEVVLRAIEMIKEAWGMMQINEVPKSQRVQSYQCVDKLCTRKYASYTIYNKTSLPFVFHVYLWSHSGENVDALASAGEDIVPPGSSVPVYIDKTLEEQVFNHRPAPSSEGLHKKLSDRAGHYFITIQFEGTSERSEPISMDLVGLTYFEVNFSKDNKSADANSGFLVPVVFDVSVQRYSKLIQLYSTVVFKNSTSVPLELRFDIPFGMSPKIVDPIYPGEAFPLPLHLAETGHLRWRPLGNNYLWNEVHNLSKMLSTESRSGFLRSLVCYPALPNSYLFRCCLSVQDVSLALSGRLEGSLPNVNVSLRQSVEASDHRKNLTKSKTRFIHSVTLNTPLTVKSYLPQAISVTVEGGVSKTVLLAEVEASFFHVDASHDLTITFHITGFRPSTTKFPRAEKFSGTAKSSGSGLSVTETMTFGTGLSDGPLHVTVEKTMDLSSGARELCISVPFLLYNCTGFVLTISRSDHELKGNCCTIPSCYDSTEQGLYAGQKDGLCLLSSEEAQYSRALHVRNGNYFLKKHISLPEEIIALPSGVVPTHSSVVHGSSIHHHQFVTHMDSSSQESSLNSFIRRSDSHDESDFKVPNVFSKEGIKAEPYMYSPDPSAAASEIMVRVSRCHTEHSVENIPSSSWSSPFFLVAPSGSTTVLVPQPSTNSAAVISVTSHLLDGPLTARTRAITFQPRYVISNACSKDLCYKQKGTEFTFHLGVGQHSHLHWKDRTRELLVAVRFDEPGWQWSGSFLPDRLGDTQVKMRNYVTGASNLIRVEVQNADVIRDEKIIGNSAGNSGTIFILLSDDDTGFVPYRIDNLSKETLRIYQQKCETLETIVYPYTSCSYSWDEPSYPHRLIVEVPGERIIGSYTLDDVKEYAPVHLSSSSLPSKERKHERTLLSSVHAEGAMKVLSIIDSSCHVLGDGKHSSSSAFGKKRESKEDVENIMDYKERLSVRISFIGISLINSYPQELLYASVKDIKVDLLQSMERQRFSFQISSLQIDNQLHGTPYPVILAFHEEYRGSLVNNVINKDGGIMTKFESSTSHPSRGSWEPVLHFMASKWRNKEMMLVSFEHICLRIGDLHLQIDLELLLKLFDFIKANPLLNPDMEASASRMDCYMYKLGVTSMPHSLQNSECLQVNGDRQLPMIGYSPPDFNPNTSPVPQIAPIGAPWQKIFLLARRQNKIYVEAFSLAPVNVTLSFSSNPWMLKRGGLSSGESLIHRGIMAFADVEGAQICLKELTIAHHMASWESIQQILYKHYTRQFLHEMYKVFGSAGVIGNPMGFARRVGLGFKDFLSVPTREVLQSPSGIISGMAHGTSSLLSNTLYAISDTATQFSKAAHKGILAFTFDDHDVAKMDKQRIAASSQTKGVINELLEGLTGVLQSPIKGAEKHGLPGVLSGLALGVTGLVAKPAASVLEVTGMTAQSIRNRSRLHRMGLHLRVRLPRHLSSELPLKPYSWEEAIGSSVLLEVDDGFKFKDEVLIMCKSLKDAGKFVVLTEKLIIIVQCSSLANLGKPEFQGVVAEPEWIVEVEIALESVIHVDVDGEVVHIVGSNSETVARQNQHHQKRTGTRMKRWNQSPTTLPLFQTNLELASKEEADYFLRVLLSTIEQGRDQGWGNVYLLHQRNLK